LCETENKKSAIGTAEQRASFLNHHKRKT
jgi:hypothetical protein